ncbi:CLUMA_CG010701, isoform A [Clunio marinus]|uniref:CLUMA_CG010701, isoform A n=1 Tax=Clunio marinus TaxID=568069 RepID=A0A1J1IC31_9DIPT|nr:CLUMA_CG010701, isoform A [Clunio marinus]
MNLKLLQTLLRKAFTTMKKCGNAINHSISTLELNDTGSFPDEVEMTPMCFLKCYLESIGVLDKELQINRVKAVELYNLNDDSETYDDCADDMSSENVTDECEKAYFFVRCVMSRKLFDNLEEDEMV